MAFLCFFILSPCFCKPRRVNKGVKGREEGVSRLPSAGVKRTIPSALENIARSIVSFTPLSLPFTPETVIYDYSWSFMLKK